MMFPKVAPRWSVNGTHSKWSGRGHYPEADPSSHLAELPSHLWCWLARHGDIADFGAILCCSTTLAKNLSFEALWHYHAFSSGYARPVVGADVDWIFPYKHDGSMEFCIDWKKFLYMSCATRQIPSIWVRIYDVDIRMPLPPTQMQNPVAGVLAELDRLTYAVSKHSARGASSSSSSVANMRTHLRLRMLQWAGRPGPVMTGMITAGDHLLLEWVSRWDSRWPLPPHAITTATPPLTPSQPRSTSPTASSLFSAWRKRFHCGSSPVSPADAAEERPQGCQVLVRVKAVAARSVPLVDGELWLLVNLTSDTLRCLYDSLEALLRQESPCKDKLSACLEFHLMDCQMPQKKMTYPDTMLLRELCWTHCETVCLELNPKDKDRHQIYVRREREMVMTGMQTLGANGVSTSTQESESSSSTAPATMPKTQMWWNDDEFATQVDSSECSQLRSTPHSMHINDGGCERVHSPVSCRMRPGQDFEQPTRSARGPGWHATVAGHPGDTAVESEEEPAAGSASDPATGVVWERLAPHYKPKLLVNTHQTRQFEFHPSLPQVLLTGDKKGGVNVIHTEEDKLHRPLVVDSCPVLGLAWMSHHPQSAVCGAAHSGQISFLKYDPSAAAQEPVVQRVLKVDQFPKLSSLSINCTDDFLLVSGFTHDLALYDTGTGQVLHRVYEAHSHFINISRFARRAPHIFATASFDHTCKLWDIRQPLLHDRPVKVLNTGGLNVMCTFSPDDRYLLCSGIDTNITQFELPSYRTFPDKFRLRPAMHHARYRRATYFATGRHFVTAATDESHIRIMSASGKSMGVIDFCGILGRTSANLQRPLPKSEMRRILGMPRRLCKWDGFDSKPQRAERREEPQVMWEDGSLVQGEVQLDDELACMEGRTCREYVQSVRTHPIVENRVGVLLSSTPPDPQSYIAFVHLHPNHGKYD